MDKQREMFEQSLQHSEPPAGASVLLESLWYDAKGNWKKAHDLIDKLSGVPAAAVHAYLHRVEGDNWNANYWYTRAGRKMQSIPLKKEWEQLVDEQFADS